MSLDHIGELPEVQDWVTTAGAYAEVESPAALVNELAEAALAAADREVERLKCCGNCGRNSDIGSVSGLNWRCATDEEAEGAPPRASDRCHFKPSSWIDREGSEEVDAVIPDERPICSRRRA